MTKLEKLVALKSERASLPSVARPVANGKWQCMLLAEEENGLQCTNVMCEQSDP